MTDLDKLIEAVEAGEKWDEAQYRVFGDGTENVTLYQKSFDGSLDAALQLHEALLPGWIWNVVSSEATVWPDYPGDPGDYQEGYCEGKPARAWLLAILRALKAKEASQ